jgi:hypothetical protein
MRSYIKIYGPPILKAIRELEKIAVDMPEVCIMDTMIAGSDVGQLIAQGAEITERVMDYFATIPADLDVERCSTIISKSGEMLGEYDFFFEWFTDPNAEQVNDLIGKIDEALSPLGCMYSIVTK